ncbi:MAG: VOC family protein [Planctomycetaceae bacterium]|nr:VOC family protein [Planctomycetaceae bacterium]
MTRITSRVSPVLGVPHVRRAAEYYRDVLGFTLDAVDGIFAPPGTEPRGVYAIVKLGDAWIHFQSREVSMKSGERPALERDVYLYVNDVAELFAEMKHRGAKIFQEPFDAPYGIREFVVEDLNGYRLAFRQPT